ncbi:hypothetical protein AC579_701 [Pseudocercospora musae]|uniref:Uncharacterized protein n=1 Tax=Pseudocercospora musae TaxID=113226 RepID=A0A139ICF9_9PEZI|nr:hypothetical protein AC579_701 [Pseudocercospora musae]
MTTLIQGNTASSHARQHNGNVYNTCHSHYTVSQQEQDGKAAKQNQSLLEAAAEGQTRRLRRLIELGADAEHADSEGMTALHHAALSGFEDTVEALLDRDVNINARSGTYGTPLCVASIKRRENIVRILLQHRASADAPGACLGSALHAVCASGDVKIAELLLKAGLGVNTRRTVQWSVVSDLKLYGTLTDRQYKFADCQPLHVAARHGHKELAMYLVKSGADINARYSWWDGVDRTMSFEECVPEKRSDRQTALLAASAAGDADTVLMLVGAGAYLEATDKLGGTALSHAAYFDTLATIPALLDAGANLNHQNIDGASPAALAAQLGNMGALKLLRERGAFLEQKSKLGRTVLALAAEQGQLGAVIYLIDQKAKLDTPGIDGRTALSQAVRFNHVAVAEVLLKAGANMEKQDEHGRTPLSAAAAAGALECVELLVDFRAALNTKDGYGATPLTLAVENGQSNIVGQLLRAGADVEARDKFGRTALAYAARRGDVASVDKLLRYDAGAVEIACNEGLTPLALAVSFSHHQVAQRLLEIGASVRSRAGHTHNALEYARENGCDPETLRACSLLATLPRQVVSTAAATALAKPR